MINKWILLGLLILPVTLSAQKIFWSDISPVDLRNAGEAGRLFLQHLEKRNVDSVQNLLSTGRVYTGDGNWLRPKDLSAKLMDEAPAIPVQQVQLTAYRFDDFLENFEQNRLLEGLYPVFDNHSVLLTAKYAGSQSVTQVLRKESDGWRITGLDGFGLKPESRKEPGFLPEEGFRVEKIPEAGIGLPVPEDFSKPERAEGQVIFSLRDKTERDAVFQVLVDEIKAKVHYYTYKFVEFSNQQYDLSDLVVRYLPDGILFEYIVTDLAGVRNKGITMGMQNQGKMVIIQFYAFQDVYRKREKQIMQVFNHIER